VNCFLKQLGRVGLPDRSRVAALKPVTTLCLGSDQVTPALWVEDRQRLIIVAPHKILVDGQHVGECLLVQPKLLWLQEVRLTGCEDQRATAVAQLKYHDLN
jgi:hypothetical protein